MRITLNHLKIGQKGIISELNVDEIPLKLLEMGCLPGTEVELTHLAPFGDPIAIKVSGYTLSMRKEEAATIEVQRY